jgi:hypothetical protein
MPKRKKRKLPEDNKDNKDQKEPQAKKPKCSTSFCRPNLSQILNALNAECKMTGLLCDLNRIIADYAQYMPVQFNIWEKPCSIVSFNRADSEKKTLPFIYGTEPLDNICNEWKIKVTSESLSGPIQVQIGVVRRYGPYPLTGSYGVVYDKSAFYSECLTNQWMLVKPLHNSIITCRVGPDQRIYFYVNDQVVGHTRRFPLATLRGMCPMIHCSDSPFPVTFEVLPFSFVN